MKVFLKNESGFSLVQVMIAMGIAGVLAVFLMRLTENMQKTQRYAEVKNNELEIFSRIGNYLNIPSMCDAAVQGIRPGGELNILQFNTQGLGSRWVIKEEIVGTGLIVEKMQIKPEVVKMGDQGLYEVTLRMTLKRKDGNLLMAGSTKAKEYAFVAKLCEIISVVIPEPINYGTAMKICHTQGAGDDIDYYRLEPSAKLYNAGDTLECILCGKDKAISKCGT